MLAKVCCLVHPKVSIFPCYETIHIKSDAISSLLHHLWVIERPCWVVLTLCCGLRSAKWHDTASPKIKCRKYTVYMYIRVPINSDHLLHMATGNKPNILYRFKNVSKYWYGILKNWISKYENNDINSNIGLKWC